MTIQTRTMTCAGGMPAFVAVPDGAAKRPCIIVIHERYGLVRHICELAERFARDGYVAIAPDLYHTHPDQDALHRGDVGADITDPDAVVALDAAIDALKAFPQADTSRIVAMGICQTARLPIVLAAARPVLAALVWYGAAQPREWAVNAKYPRAFDEIIASADCPVLGIFGETDHIISLADVRTFRDCLDRQGKSYDIRVYRDSPHGFLNDTMPGRYRPAQAEAAWVAQRDFLQRALAPNADRKTRTQRYACDSALDYDFSRNVRHE